MADKGSRTGKTLGGALFEWRTASSLSLGEVSQITGAPITQLLDIESDKIGPNAVLLTRLAALYSDDCLGCREEAGWDAVLSWLHTFAEFESPTNRELLTIVATSIRRMRNLPATGLVMMRDQEADIIFSVLDLTDEKLVGDVEDIFGIEADAATALVERSAVRQERSEASRTPLIERIGSTLGMDVGDLERPLELPEPPSSTESTQSAA